ncbi:MarR family winged helix-turn-helix transcriptional regulator [Sphingomonas sp.]|uniref:MarR family winged helix-turn-helix transcriptional regulator n=1 Tax=Sphingomonas sp. TaxID=28214 RepID=UPI002C047542|nr:MarR family winged helix-turn-helix transcriptional regulator [Sphingomonas sp.]HWK34857.1 MarR family winged helix-turn-helix transcriptional regulator [Sphingomonas sp.]
MTGHSVFRSSFGSIGARLGFPLRQVDVAWLRTLSDQLRPLGVSPGRTAALFFIENNPGCSQARLGEALRINRPSTARAVDELVALGAVERRKASPKARDNALFLTDHGRTLHTRIDALAEAHEAAFFAPLSASERERLRTLLLKLL